MANGSLALRSQANVGIADEMGYSANATESDAENISVMRGPRMTLRHLVLRRD